MMTSPVILYTLKYFIKHESEELPYSLLSIGPGADPGVEAVSPQVILSHLLSGK